MLIPELFEILDVDADGRLSRSDLERAARGLGWHWAEAPLYAILDHLTTLSPLGLESFVAIIEEITRDRYGPYGRVLMRSPLHVVPPSNSARIPSELKPVSAKNHCEIGDFSPDSPRSSALAGSHFEGTRADCPPLSVTSDRAERPENADLAPLLEKVAGADVAAGYLDLSRSPSGLHIDPDRSAMLIIDPQRSFTTGAWKESIGPGAERDVAPLSLAFGNCAQTVGTLRGRVEIMFTRCPFPPNSYQWDDSISGVLAGNQLYFVKPGNSVLWPPTNGFAQWVDGLARAGKTTLVMGGCTLNSCVRVSAVETQQRFGQWLQVVVDLSLCGARTSNYIRSEQFGGMSSVALAVREMRENGVIVTGHCEAFTSSSTGRSG